MHLVNNEHYLLILIKTHQRSYFLPTSSYPIFVVWFHSVGVKEA